MWLAVVSFYHEQHRNLTGNIWQFIVYSPADNFFFFFQFPVSYLWKPPFTDSNPQLFYPDTGSAASWREREVSHCFCFLSKHLNQFDQKNLFWNDLNSWCRATCWIKCVQHATVIKLLTSITGQIQRAPCSAEMSLVFAGIRFPYVLLEVPPVAGAPQFENHCYNV